MPYIPQAARPEFDPGIRLLVNDLSHDFSAANLNYIFCSLANAYIEHHGLRYPNIKDIQGVFTGALDEFNERVARPYESTKMNENGTVWTCMGPVVYLKVTSITQPADLTEAELPDKVTCEETHQTWMKCRHPECDLHVTGPGRIDCEGFCLDDEDFSDWNQ